jgi:hypothetical protein
MFIDKHIYFRTLCEEQNCFTCVLQAQGKCLKSPNNMSSLSRGTGCWLHSQVSIPGSTFLFIAPSLPAVGPVQPRIHCCVSSFLKDVAA